ncbi:MAG TPA: thiamine pyrophosphate-requiring protein, partial [Candidatus Limnocylindrales bacterium]|nr:thiamine pyrophosphate-requiring protein [Candidatus Limnocylindrales bacterium]
MNVVDAIAEILKREQVEYLMAYPTTSVIDAAAAAGIRPVLCRQERVGVGIADGYSRTTNGRKLGVFAMQYGPGAENAFSGVATAFSDSVPMLVLPLGHPRDRAQVFPLFSSARTYASVTKAVETLNQPDQVSEVMRRAFNLMRMGRPGPVMVEIPADVAVAEVPEKALQYKPVKATAPAGNPRDVAEAARVLVQARRPVIHAGQGVLYAEAGDELRELAELLQAPVMTTLEGKSAFPENHALALGTGGGGVMSGPVYQFLPKSDVIFGIGCSFTRHGMAMNVPEGKVLIHATNDERDLNKNYAVEHPILGDAKLVLRQFIDAVKDLRGTRGEPNGAVAAEVKAAKTAWLAEWMPKLTSDEVPITPYRVMWEFMQTIDSRDAIVTHDSGSPRNQLVPFYSATASRGYMGWGKSHALGTGLGLIMGAKLAAPDKFCVNFMGDAAFGMTGLDFETAVRCGIPITTIVLNNSAMAIERHALVVSHDRYRTRDIGGNYADMGRAMGGHAERVEKPAEIAGAIERARKLNAEG